MFRLSSMVKPTISGEQSLLCQLTILPVPAWVASNKVHLPLGFADIAWEVQKIYSLMYVSIETCFLSGITLYSFETLDLPVNVL